MKGCFVGDAAESCAELPRAPRGVGVCVGWTRLFQTSPFTHTCGSCWSPSTFNTTERQRPGSSPCPPSSELTASQGAWVDNVQCPTTALLLALHLSLKEQCPG